jgi:hypothetical protein
VVVVDVAMLAWRSPAAPSCGRLQVVVVDMAKPVRRPPAAPWCAQLQVVVVDVAAPTAVSVRRSGQSL